MNQYRVTVKHDKGTAKLLITADTMIKAIEQVIKIEGCPQRTIKTVTHIREL